MPLEVMEEAQRDFLDYNNTGMGICEMSHRSKPFDAIHNECISLIREMLNVPDNYSILLVQGGASTQFEAVPLNLLVKGRADYVVTGKFAKDAFNRAKKYGDVVAAASSEDKKFTYIPKVTPDMFRDDIDYVHVCYNNTIFGTHYNTLPDVGDKVLVADMSSCIMSEEIDVSKFGVIYAGAQKNLAPAGLTIVIVRNDLIGNHKDICPTMLAWKTQADKNSLFNTPPCFSIYMCCLVLRYLKKTGGIKAKAEVNRQKAKLLYDYIDSSDFYTNKVEKDSRSLMNVPFFTPNEELDALFVKESAAAGLSGLKGHREVGGLRASIYNAMTLEGVQALVDFMKKFAAEHAQ